jgi:hypothetical protein
LLELVSELLLIYVESLRQLLVIPLSPEPEDVKVVLEEAPIGLDGSDDVARLNDPDGLTSDQRNQVEQYIRQLKVVMWSRADQKKTLINWQTNDTKPDTAGRLPKREREDNNNVVKKKAKVSRKIEIIDLTDD